MACLPGYGFWAAIEKATGHFLGVRIYRVSKWFLPQVNRVLPGARPLPGGDYAVTTAPYTGDAVLYLRKVE